MLHILQYATLQRVCILVFVLLNCVCFFLDSNMFLELVGSHSYAHTYSSELALITLTNTTLETMFKKSRTIDLSDVLPLFQPTEEDVISYSQSAGDLIKTCTFNGGPCSAG